MKSRLAVLALVFVLVVIATGCFLLKPAEDGPKEQDGDQRDTEPNGAEDRVSQQLVEIFPQKIGYEWIYSGFAEYGHRMRLDNISGSTESSEVLVYEISGEVYDPSGGEASGDFSLEMEYVITKDTVTERIIKGEKLIHVFRELELLKLPLQTGTKWQQKVEVNGKEQVLTAEILSAEAEEEQGPVIYKVRYTVPMEGMPDGLYVEERTFAEGKGVIHYARTLGKEYDFMFEYYLYEPEND